MTSREIFMEAAWHDFMLWAVKQDFLIVRFEDHTGFKFQVPPTSALEAMIDQVTGFDGKPMIAEFIIWASIWEWGEAESPPLLQVEITRRRAAGDVPEWLQEQDDPDGRSNGS